MIHILELTHPYNGGLSYVAYLIFAPQDIKVTTITLYQETNPMHTILFGSLIMPKITLKM